jgi:hypothetical protein
MIYLGVALAQVKIVWSGSWVADRYRRPCCSCAINRLGTNHDKGHY